MTRLISDRLQIRRDKYEIQKVKNKANKPVADKRRREKLNKCLVRLKSVVFRDAGKEEKRLPLGKTDILEMTISQLVKIQNAKSSGNKVITIQKDQENLRANETNLYGCVKKFEDVQVRRPTAFLRQVASTKLRGDSLSAERVYSTKMQNSDSTFHGYTINYSEDMSALNCNSFTPNFKLGIITDENCSGTSNFLRLFNSHAGEFSNVDHRLGTPLFSSTPNHSNIGRPLHSSTPVSSADCRNISSRSVRTQLFNQSEVHDIISANEIEQSITSLNCGNRSYELWRPWML